MLVATIVLSTILMATPRLDAAPAPPDHASASTTSTPTGSTTSTPTTSTTSTSSTSTPAEAAPAVSIPAHDRSYREPTGDVSNDRTASLAPTDAIADPDLLRVGTGSQTRFFAYATNNLTGHMPYRTSTDLVHWAVGGDAMPWGPGSWAEPGYTWAPEVTRFGSTYVAFYSARVKGGSSRQCIGRATATAPEGPFIDTSSAPFICWATGGSTLGGAIDASVTFDGNGIPWILWKNDGNNPDLCRCASKIWIRRLSTAGTTMVGASPVALIDSGSDYTIENPDLVPTAGGWTLFYSAGFFGSPDYRTDYARCSTPLGPCVRTTERFLATGGTRVGPGGASFAQDLFGHWWTAYHSGLAFEGGRGLRIGAVAVDPPRPRIDWGSTRHARDPGGSLDAVVPSGGGAIVRGWAADPDATGPVEVHLYARTPTGAMVAKGAGSTASDRGDLIGYGLGTKHGYSAFVSLLGGTKSVCAFAINQGPGAVNTHLGCRDVTIRSGNPFGSFDTTRAAPGSVTATGWALDPDTRSAVTTHVYVDGRLRTTATADGNRPDVERAHPGYGSARGWSTTVSGLAGGPHEVCVYAINAGPGNANPLLGCRTVVAPSGNPHGSFDQISGDAAGLTVAGWAIDPDTAAPIKVHVYIDGRPSREILADQDRPDVGNAWPDYGPKHGWSLRATGLAPGPHTVCVYAIDVGGATVNPLLGCRSAIVPH